MMNGNEFERRQMFSVVVIGGERHDGEGQQ
jgi:hypothetical protein